MADEALEEQNEYKQFRLVGIVFGVVIALLVVGYFLFLRFNYATIYQNLSSEEASAVVAELDVREIKYRLKNGGSDIQVPAHKAASIRLMIVGAEAPAKKLVGFELFDESEMGLTDFAQKIKYQRALQGELARTIMMMDGVANARVHIAIPERALFRGNESSKPKAAVTIVTREAYVGDTSLITGIQRLVAASVPELKQAQVVVLNAEGEEISKRPEILSASNAVAASPEISNIESDQSTELALIETTEVENVVPIPSMKTLIASSDPDTIPAPAPEIVVEGSVPEITISKSGQRPDTTLVKPFPLWLAFALGFLVLVFIALMFRRVTKTILNDTEHEEFAETLRSKLSGIEEVENVT